MSDEKRLIFAIGIGITIMMLWNALYLQPKQEAYQAFQESQKEKQVTAESIAESVGITLEPGQKAAVDVPEQAVEAPRLKIDNDDLEGSISLRGARIDDLTLKKYHLSEEPGSDDVVLLSPRGTDHVYFAEFGWQANTSTPTSATVWSADSTELEVNKPTTLRWVNESGVPFEQVITLDEHYMFTIEQRVTNTGTTPLSFRPYSLVNRTTGEMENFFISHEGPIAVADSVLEEIDYEDLRDGDIVEYKGVKGWTGFGDKYWLTALVPDSEALVDIRASYANRDNQHRYQMDIKGSTHSVLPGESLSVTQRFYAGPKKLGLLDDYSEQFNIALFDRAVDFGWLYFLTRPMFEALQVFNSWLGNFGLAILLLTVVVKLLLFPLANKSYKSMAQLKHLTPEIQKLRERYADDRQKLSMETMKFYKDQKINPLSGCLPMLLQIPIFFSLYKVLFVTIEMRHAPFYGWITDLSAPDPTNVLNLFGLLPYTPPEWLPAIGVLPLLFGLSMVVQQRLNPAPTDPTQAAVMKWLPVVFVFLFAGFSAGLVLYWVWNNILSIAQQGVIMRGIEKADSKK